MREPELVLDLGELGCESRSPFLASGTGQDVAAGGPLPLGVQSYFERPNDRDLDVGRGLALLQVHVVAIDIGLAIRPFDQHIRSRSPWRCPVQTARRTAKDMW